MSKKQHIDTLLVHAENNPEKNRRAATMPIYQTTAYKYQDCEEISRVYKGESAGHIFTRVSNPTLDILERRLSAVEDGLGAISMASGMAAITCAALTLAKSGHEIISSRSIFGGTYALFNKTLRELGINTVFADPAKPREFETAVSDKTRAIFIETIGNPQMDVPDIAAIASIAHKYGLPLIVDSTVTTPCLIRPKDWGANLIIHSTSKFINGHGNSIGGVLIDCGNFDWEGKRFRHFEEYARKYGQLAFLTKARREIFRDFGPTFSPFNAFATAIGLETLSLRMQRHCSNAMALAGFLAEHTKVRRVNYPGLPSNPFHALAQKQFQGRFGSLLTFEMENQEQSFKVIEALKLAYNLANLGDAKTLVIHPASTIFVEFEKEERAKLGVSDGLIRVSVGIEYIDDIIEDFKQGLEKI